MKESGHPTNSTGVPTTPEMDQLLNTLELQAAALRRRSARAGGALQSTAFRYGSLVAIIIFAFGSLGVLEWLLSQMPKPARPAETPAAAVQSAVP